jgi:hypothetical protein
MPLHGVRGRTGIRKVAVTERARAPTTHVVGDSPSVMMSGGAVGIVNQGCEADNDKNGLQ